MLISCVEDLSYHTSININLHLFGLLLSTALLVVSLAIFTIFPRLKDFHVTTLATIKVQWWTFYSSLSCTRVAVHRNFFLSLVCLSITIITTIIFDQNSNKNHPSSPWQYIKPISNQNHPPRHLHHHRHPHQGAEQPCLVILAFSCSLPRWGVASKPTLVAVTHPPPPSFKHLIFSDQEIFNWIRKN